MILAKSKISSILDEESTTLKDCQQSNQEFRLVMDEVDKYTVLKEKIRSESGDTYASIAINETAEQVLLKNRRF